MIQRHILAVAIVLGVTCIPAPAGPSKEPPEGAKRELKALDGKWRVTRFVHSDRETTPETGDDDVVVTFKDGAIDFGGVATGKVLELDPATDPKCLDFKIGVGSGVFREGTTYESVYKRDGDTLTWAVHTGREKNRPSNFDKPTDAGVMVMVLDRVKR